MNRLDLLHVRRYEIEEVLYLFVVRRSLANQAFALTGDDHVFQPQKVAVSDPRVDQLIQTFVGRYRATSAAPATATVGG